MFWQKMEICMTNQVETVRERKTGSGLFVSFRGRTAVLAISLVILTGCGRPPELVGIDNPETPVLQSNVGTNHKIFIATTRQASEVVGALYSDERTPELGLASVEVHVPPNHVKGELERPKQLPPDPETEFAVVQPTIYANDSSFIAALNQELATRPPGKRDILVFIHGYNTTTSDAILRLGQFVEDTNYQGVPVLFAWASAGKLSKYVYDMNSALTARPKIGELAQILSRTNANGYDLFAHSMGSLLTMEGIVNADLQGRFNTAGRLKTIMLASPDIDIDLFQSQLSQIDTRLDMMYVLVSKDDSALRVSRAVSGGIDRVGAADADKVASFGVKVIDLSEIDDSASGSHSKFAGSPEVVQLIGEGLNSNSEVGVGYTPTLGGLISGIPIRIIGN
jgi:esterase/lipase superfamily enzyme